MRLPADGHVHSEWSWDAPNGSMESTCRRAISLGLPAVAFTEHADYTPWMIRPADLDEHQHLSRFATPDGMVVPPEFDLQGYLSCVQRCRDLFPRLRILVGVELGEPHRRSEAAARLLAAGQFDRVLGSLHCLPRGDRFSEMPSLFEERPAAEVIRDYLAEVVHLIEGCATFSVLAHIDYAARYWPAAAGIFRPGDFEQEFRYALRVLAESDRALEVNTRAALLPEVVAWWRDEGGKDVAFGSDAHDPTLLAFQFHEAADMVAAHGFRPGRHPSDFWSLPRH